MAAKTCLVLFALFYSGQCNPLGQTTVCESQSIPNMMPPTTTTVCESAPSFPYYPFFNNLALPLPMPLPMPMPLPIPCPPLPIIQPSPVGQTTVCESQPSYGPLMDPTFGAYPLYPRPVPGMGQTTVCESQPNIGLYPRPMPMPMPMPMPLATSTVCESAPNFLGYPFGFPLRPLSPLVY